MLPNLAFRVLLFACLSSVLAIGQEKPAAALPPSALELPVIFQQGITAGKTATGTKVQAKLQVATLVGRTVIPRDAVLEGEVIESAEKTKTEASSLAIHITTAQWKNGSEKLNVYLVPWFYPPVMQEGQELQYGPQQPASRTWNGQGQYPDSSRGYKPFPGSDSGKDSAAPDTPSAVASQTRLRMKGIESQRSEDGVVKLVSQKSNIKLDRLTTYVLSESDVAPASRKN